MYTHLQHSFYIRATTLFAMSRTCSSLRALIGKHCTGRAYGVLFLLSGLTITTNVWVAAVRWCLESFFTISICKHFSVRVVFSFTVSYCRSATLSLSEEMSTMSWHTDAVSSCISWTFQANFKRTFWVLLADPTLSLYAFWACRRAVILGKRKVR